MKPEPFRILCFGDSLTWGLDPGTGRRHGEDVRWPCVMQQALGPGVRAIEEGQGGRSTVFDDPDSDVDKNGARALPIILSTHQPLDLVILMLGANDLKPGIRGDPQAAAEGMERLVHLVRSHPWHASCAVPSILIVSPPHFRTTAKGEPPRMGRRIEDSRQLAPLYADVATREDCGFFDAATVATASDVDGVHLEAADTRAIGAALAGLVARTFLPPAPESSKP
jgi:lysophospholipase L1-like esterase